MSRLGSLLRKLGLGRLALGGLEAPHNAANTANRRPSRDGLVRPSLLAEKGEGFEKKGAFLVECLNVKVGDRVRRTQTPFSANEVTYLGEQSLDELCGTLFRVVAVHREGLVHLEVFGAGGVLPQGMVLAVPEAYFAAPYWQTVPPLLLQLADRQGLEVAQAMVKARHYLQREVHQLARPMAYLVLREYDREPVGTVIFSRPQCARVYGSARDETAELGRWGNLNDVQKGRAPRTQWEIVNLARFYLEPCLQRRDGRDYVPNAASILLSQALWSVCVDYLRAFPPAYFTQPWELRECVSYCSRERYFCTLYLASAFRLVRTNGDGLHTFSRPLRGLMPHEKKEIRQASLMNKWAREHRAETEFEATMTSHPVLRRHGGREDRPAA